jgi:ribose-phosphate pyrophosphokinase
MEQILFSFPGAEAITEKILRRTGAEKGNMILHTFPDGENYLRVNSVVEKKQVLLICPLDHPNEKLLNLFFLCKLLKELKAENIVLISPYIPYMRQDRQFNPGEALTSAYFASLLSSFVDRLVTIDPHLHRRKSMQEIYSIPCEVLHSAKLIADWVKKNIPDALLIGPDSESRQWVGEVAGLCDLPYLVLEKVRKDDEHVQISLPDIERYLGHTPVLLDDIISTGKTMLETMYKLKAHGMKAPVCIGVHGIFARNAYAELKSAGAKEIVTCNTIDHVSNGIDISSIVIDAIVR